LYFSATGSSTNGTELYTTDGTSIGTVLVKDISAGSASSSPKFLTVFKNLLYFAANDGINGNELFTYDGTSVLLVKDINPGSANSDPSRLTVFNDRLFFAANDGTNGQCLWWSDGTESGTLLLIETGVAGAGGFSLVKFDRSFTVFNNSMYITASGVNAIGDELWLLE
jgi:ELWxxDGT repeat protein